MRGWVALLGSLTVLAGCRSAAPPVNHETHAHLPSRGYVPLHRLADDLDLEYHGAGPAFIELSAPPDHVVLVQNSRRAVVNGSHLAMDHPCIQRGDEFVVTSADAVRVGAALRAARSARREPAPLRAPTVRRPRPRAGALPGDWRPDRGVRMRDWKYIVIHHSASARDSAASIHRYHKEELHYDGLGYHFVIGNGSQSGDGLVEVGYRWRRQVHGAHARARTGDDNRWNLHSIGICLVGDFRSKPPSARQMDALVTLVRTLRREYGIRPQNVVPHRFVKPTVCPGPRFPWSEFASRIR